MDFLYFGEANVYQEDLDSFLAIAEEIQLKGLTGQTSGDLIEEEQPKHSEPLQKSNISQQSTNLQTDKEAKEEFPKKSSTGVAISSQSSADLEALVDKVKSMMQKGEKMISTGGKNRNGTPTLATSYICKVCDMEGRKHVISDHIEANHLEGLSIPCDNCDKTCSSRKALGKHKIRFHE
jgi:hypothetical protein